MKPFFFIVFVHGMIATAMAQNPPLIPFTVFNDNIGSMGQNETRVVIKTNMAYRNYFGHSVPPGVNFATDWVVFYSAGTKTTGGYLASVTKISQSPVGNILKITTSLNSPGTGCLVTQALTKPFVLAKFSRQQANVQSVQYYKDDKVRNCR